MQPRRLDNGNILMPVRMEGPNGELGDGMVEITPEDPEFGKMQAELPLDEAGYNAALDRERENRGL